MSEVSATREVRSASLAPPRDGPETVDILGVPIEAVDLERSVVALLRARDDGRRLALHFCTTHTLVLAGDDPGLRRSLLSGLNVPDGVPLVWVGRLRGARIGRVCGLDLMPALVDRGRALGRRHYLYGGAPGTPERLAARLAERFPGASIVGVESPPFRPLTAEERAATIERINAADPDYVWVGLGTPKQDHWVADYRDDLRAPALLAVGAAFDIVSGRKRRAPVVMQRLGLEWLFRLMLEPGRLWRRYAVANVRFAWSVALESVSRSTR